MPVKKSCSPGRHVIIAAVKGWVDLLLGVIAAAATAWLLALIARNNIGMPPDMVREDALVAASIMVAVAAAVSRRKPKQKL
jgi:hypothetical protein